jgi:hypothetical protein
VERSGDKGSGREETKKVIIFTFIKLQYGDAYFILPQFILFNNPMRKNDVWTFQMFQPRLIPNPMLCVLNLIASHKKELWEILVRKRI